jgi:hypothetical protein
MTILIQNKAASKHYSVRPATGAWAREDGASHGFSVILQRSNPALAKNGGFRQAELDFIASRRIIQ